MTSQVMGLVAARVAPRAAEGQRAAAREARVRCAIAWTVGARRALARLPEKVAVAVIEFLYGSLAACRTGSASRSGWGLEGLHSARRGDYRAIYRIDDDRRRVDVVAIEHRSDIYRPRQLERRRVGGWLADAASGFLTLALLTTFREPKWEPTPPAQGHARPRPANLVVARTHVRPHRATPGDVGKAPPKQ